MGEISAAEIIWDPTGTPVSFKSAFGTAVLRGTDTIADIQEERFGDAAVSAVHGGMVLELEVPVTRTELAKLVTLLHGVITGDELSLVNKAGCEAAAKPLYIRPMCGGDPDSDKAKWINLYAVYPFRNFELSYDRSTQRVFNVIFRCFVSTESGTIDEFGTIGVN
jgi:hypothetical protein